jgi:hypothetical protein
MRRSLRLGSILLILLLAAAPGSGRASNPTPARLAGFVAGPAAEQSDQSGMQRLGSLAGNVTSVHAAGSRAYAGGPNGLMIADVSDPDAPILLGSYPGAINDLWALGSVAYLATPDGLRIVDVANAAHPALLGRYDLPMADDIISQRASRVQVVGYQAFVLSQHIVARIPPYRSELTIVDVRNPSRPALISRYDLGPSFNDLAVKDGYAYIGGTVDVGGATLRFFNPYLSIIDVRDPAVPVRVGWYRQEETLWQFGGGAVDVAGGIAYLGLLNGPTLYTIDISDPRSPALLGKLPTDPEPAFTATDLHVIGQFAYVAGAPNGLSIVDIRNPAAPAQIYSSDEPPGTPPAIDVAGDIVYVAAGEAGLRMARFVPRTIAWIPSSGGELRATVGRVTYQFPAGAFAETAVVKHRLQIANDLPPAPGHFRIGPAFEITASYSATGQLAQPALPISITVQYTDFERGAAAANTPALYHWDGSAWLKEPSSQLDQAARTVTANSTQLGLWALLGDARRAALPILRR